MPASPDHGTRPMAPPTPPRTITANAVIAALAVSTCVAALACVTVVSKAVPHIAAFTARDTAQSTGVTARPLPRPAELIALAPAPTEELQQANPTAQAGRVVPARIPDAPALDLAFADPGFLRAMPDPRQRPYALAPDLPPRTDRAPSGPLADAAPVRVIAGRPAVVPPPRPDPSAGPSQRAALPASPARPTARPNRPTAEVAVTASLAAPASFAAPGAQPVDPRPSLRPAPRPVTLSARVPALSEPVLVAATVPEAAGRLRAADPVPPRAGSNPCSNSLARDVPRRPGNAAGGAAVMAAIGNRSGAERDRALVAEALSGNIPAHLRNLQPVGFTGSVAGRETRITLCVTPDYLAIGSEDDHVRVPLGLPAALRVAEGFGMMLPTPRMVDAIFAQAAVRVAPAPMPPTSAMSSTDYFLRHNATVNAQFARAGARDGALVAGHKKDVVLANRLANAPGRVAIYGWHRGVGDPIQPLSTVHGEAYADYSHGIRLVARTAYVDGRAVDLRDLLTDGRFAGMLTGDGPLTGPTVRLASLR